MVLQKGAKNAMKSTTKRLILNIQNEMVEIHDAYNKESGLKKFNDPQNIWKVSGFE